jgi:hypothetical protein
MSPVAGDYTACIHGFAPADGVSTQFTLSSWVLTPGGDVPLHVRGMPTNVAPGQSAKVKLSWKGAQDGTRYLGAVRVVQGSDPDTGATLGVTMLSVEPGMTQGVRVPSARKSALFQRR